MSQPKDTLVKRFTTRDEFIDRDTFGITLDMSGEGLVGYWFIAALGNKPDGWQGFCPSEIINVTGMVPGLASRRLVMMVGALKCFYHGQ